MKQLCRICWVEAVGESLKTAELQNLVGRIKIGDRQAADVLIRRSAQRLEALASRMLHSFPGVDRWEQTGDILQNALQRLLRTLKGVEPDSVAGFYRLAAQAVRRELLDMARHYSGSTNAAANHESLTDSAAMNGFTSRDEDNNLERSTAFHEAVGQLPEADREIVELGYYEGLEKYEIAGLLGVSEKTIRRRWDRIARRLADELGDELPS
jgi:RNA polymerase sigma-70 factor (ECF subfamily)